MGQISRGWCAGLALLSGTCLVLTACQGSTATVAVPTAGVSSAPNRTPTGSPVTESPPTASPATAGSPIASTVGLQDGAVYGVGMPVTVDFSVPIPDRAKADVERRLSVRSDPPQVGGWRWYGDQEVIYRPKDLWRRGTTVRVSTALGGVPVAGGHVDTDRRVTASIGRKMTFQISDATKQMRVFQNDKLVKTFPVSLGAPDTPSSTGNMVVMTREAEALWVYSADDQLDVKYAERLTADGEYIHAARSGTRTGSHRCTTAARRRPGTTRRRHRPTSRIRPGAAAAMAAMADYPVGPTRNAGVHGRRDRPRACRPGDTGPADPPAGANLSNPAGDAADAEQRSGATPPPLAGAGREARVAR